MKFSIADLSKQVSFKTSRSSGKGGQNVNKVSSKVELNMSIPLSDIFTEAQKMQLMKRLANRINTEGILQIVTEEDRSQLKNKQRSLEKLQNLIEHALYQAPIRKATKPKRSAVETRLRDKQLKALKKINRRNYSDN